MAGHFVINPQEKHKPMPNIFPATYSYIKIYLYKT